MKIPGKDQQSLLEKTILGSSRGVSTTKAGKSQASQPASPSSATDQVDISQQARTFQKISQLAKTGTDLRAEKVEQVRTQVEAGTYKPNATNIAEKLLRSTLLDNLS